MKPIVNEYPKFLKVNSIPVNRDVNKHLIKPWRLGEIVKVAPMEEQVRDSSIDHMFRYSKQNDNPEWFRKRYCVVYRKDENGEWKLKYTESWKSFDVLTKSKR